jgi:HTH-type transcriptional regulator/antitoxin HipB
MKMTQEQLAKKSGTNKAYISRIENDASDIRLSTLMRIINKGLGGKLKFSVKI